MDSNKGMLFSLYLVIAMVVTYVGVFTLSKGFLFALIYGLLWPLSFSVWFLDIAIPVIYSTFLEALYYIF